MTPKQCREVRELLRWGRHELAAAAEVPFWFVAMFEDKGDPDEAYVNWEVRLIRALDDAGARFPFEIAGGKSRPARAYLSLVNKDEPEEQA